MRKLFSLILLFSILSCDTVDEKYLYDEGDFEYPHLLALEAQQCIDDASIFTELDKTGDFLNSAQLGRIYKVIQDASSANTLYIKITNVTALQMELTVNGTDNTYDKVLTFEKTDHDSLLSELKVMACNNTYKDNFASSGLNDSEKMSLVWSKENINVVDSPDDEDDEPEVYDRRTDTYEFNDDYPLLFFYYNATKEAKRVLTDNADETKSTSVLTITEVTTEDECDFGNTSQNTACDFEAATVLTFDTCSLTISSNIYTSNKYEDELITSTGTGGCVLLPSAI